LNGDQGVPGPQGPAGTSPYTFGTASNQELITCEDINGCTYTNLIIVATAPPLTSRVSLLFCITPQITTMSAVAYIPPYDEVDLGCMYSGTLTKGQILTIGATMLYISGLNS
jgi:hypothetical protein